MRGEGGPVYITLPTDPIPIAPALVEAAHAIGIPRADDLNAETMESNGGCGIANITVKDGNPHFDGQCVSAASYAPAEPDRYPRRGSRACSF